MLKLNDGTTYRENDNGIVLMHGKRTLHILCQSVDQLTKARDMITKTSFNALFNKGKAAPKMKNIAYFRV
ncbi:MAG: hypothetical protein KGJ13_07515 [Patescibacteria group bacterium]|nr:hypothetical protein [Patescibacteria group bacterium]